MPGITIIGTGSYVPGEPVTNAALSRVMDTSDEWIKKRSGISQRHFAPEGVGCSDLAVEASKIALQSAGLEAKDVDYILFATMTPDYIFPGSGCLLGSKLGLPGVPALDIRQQCAAMPFGLQVADSLIHTNAAQTILLVGAEAHAGFMPWNSWDALYGGQKEVSLEEKERATRHRSLAVLFGDGAGAFVLRKSEVEGHGFMGALLHSDGRYAEQIFIPGGGFRRRPYWSPDMFTREEHIPQMEGKELFKNAVTKLPVVVRQLCARLHVRIEDIDWLIAHQANDRINQAVTESLGIAPEKAPSNIANYGNTSGATIPILTDELVRNGSVKKGDLICFLALGAGLHWGAVLLRL